VTVGAVPFLLGDVLKAALAVAVAAGVGRIPFGR
jgi:biotin transporter BioY